MVKLAKELDTSAEVVGRTARLPFSDGSGAEGAKNARALANVGRT